jgi:hypothetical protein
MNKLWTRLIIMLLLTSSSMSYAEVQSSHSAPPAKVEVSGSITVADITPNKEDMASTPCDPPSDLRTSDLCAQWKAADAARVSSIWSIIAVFVSILTLGAVIFGFYQTRLLQKSEFRAYIRADFEKLGFLSNGCMFFDLSFGNYGRTPARNLEINCTVTVSRQGVETRYSGENITAVHPEKDVVRRFVTYGGYDPFIEADIKQGGTSVIFEVTVRYFDEFGDTRFEIFSFRHDRLPGEAIPERAVMWETG